MRCLRLLWLAPVVLWAAFPTARAADTPAPPPKPVEAAPAVAAPAVGCEAPAVGCAAPGCAAPGYGFAGPALHPAVGFRQRSVADGGGGGHPVWGTTAWPCAYGHCAGGVCGPVPPSPYGPVAPYGPAMPAGPAASPIRPIAYR